MTIQLSDHFTYRRLIRFVFPSIIMMIFTSMYSIVDGFFVSNFVGKTSFAAVNFIMPFLMMFGAFGFMLGSGGSALISKTLGEGQREKAVSYFSLIVYTTIVLGVVFSVLGMLFIHRIAAFLGAEGEILKKSILYARILIPSCTAFMLQSEFQMLLVVAGKPKLGLALTLSAGITNMVLDLLFVAVFKWGLAGAAAATVIGQSVGGLVPLVYFILPNRTLLKITKTRFDARALVKTCFNGSSELMSNISMSIVGMVYNFQLLQFAGENGVAAYGVIMYVGFIFAAVFLGFTMGSSPIVSYHYGAGNVQELKSLFKKCVCSIIIFSVILTVLALVSASPLAKLFVGYDETLCTLTIRGYSIYSLAFLLMGMNIFGSAFFTALNDGLVSGIISFLRTFVFNIAAVIVLPMILGIDGIWFAIVVSEGVSLLVTTYFFINRRKKYHYA